MELVSSNAVSQVAKMAERGIDPNFHDERSGGMLQQQSMNFILLLQCTTINNNNCTMQRCITV